MSEYDQFASKFRVKNMRVARSRYYDAIDYESYQRNVGYYTADREETIEMELTRRGFDDLVQLDRDFTKIWQDESDERYLRRMHPALEEAYSKYRMLLAIYK